MTNKELTVIVQKHTELIKMQADNTDHLIAIVKELKDIILATHKTSVN